MPQKEIAEGSKVLLEKLAKFKPKIAVFNGKGIYQTFSGQKKFFFGKQPEPINDGATWIWVMPSSSARCAQLPRAVDKIPFFAALKKLRDFLNGKIDKVEESELVFESVVLGHVPRKEGKTKDQHKNQHEDKNQHNNQNQHRDQNQHIDQNHHRDQNQQRNQHNSDFQPSLYQPPHPPAFYSPQNQNPPIDSYNTHFQNPMISKYQPSYHHPGSYQQQFPKNESFVDNKMHFQHSVGVKTENTDSKEFIIESKLLDSILPNPNTVESTNIKNEFGIKKEDGNNPVKNEKNEASVENGTHVQNQMISSHQPFSNQPQPAYYPPQNQSLPPPGNYNSMGKSFF